MWLYAIGGCGSRHSAYAIASFNVVLKPGLALQLEVISVITPQKDAGVTVPGLEVMNTLEDYREGFVLLDVQPATLLCGDPMRSELRYGLNKKYDGELCGKEVGSG